MRPMSREDGPSPNPGCILLPSAVGIRRISDLFPTRQYKLAGSRRQRIRSSRQKRPAGGLPTPRRHGSLRRSLPSSLAPKPHLRPLARRSGRSHLGGRMPPRQHSSTARCTVVPAPACSAMRCQRSRNPFVLLPFGQTVRRRSCKAQSAPLQVRRRPNVRSCSCWL